MLKQDNERAKMQQQKKGFMDVYGTKLNGDEELANLILAEVGRQSPKLQDWTSSAAMDAVQAVTDKLREEATRVLQNVQGFERQVSDLMDQVNAMSEGVDKALSSQGGAQEPALDQAPGLEEPTAPDMGAGAPPDMGAGAPPDMGAGAPPDMGAGAPPDMGAGAPPDMGAGAPPLPEQGMVPSDVRLKNMRQRFQQFAQSRKVASDQRLKTPVKKVNPNLLAGVRGMF